jgi:peptidoglycan/LPS O-acetylase OafA/YrhL
LVVKLLQFTPLHLLWAGYEAVLLFFVLSGFVLALPYWSGKPFMYGAFAIKRWARVWIPYMVVVTAAGVAALLFRDLPVNGLSSWFDNGWAGLSVEGYLNHVALIGDLDQFSMQFIPVVWSLRYEMLASLAFPLLLYLDRALSWPLVLLIGAVLNIVGVHYINTLRPFQFVLMFLVGILLAKHKDRLISGFGRLPRISHVPLLALALALYICTWLNWHDAPSAFTRSLFDWSITAASAFAILAALASRTAHRMLTWRPVVWLGKVSYSLYLTHTLVQLTVIHLLGRILPVPVLLALCIPLTLLLSQLTYRYVEVPAIALGKRLSAKPLL